jgi:Ser/Thr protein kinase RdoA (MazF antagonist)
MEPFGGLSLRPPELTPRPRAGIGQLRPNARSAVLVSSLNPCLALWAEAERGRVALINHSENHTFRIDQPGGRRFILRVHRPGYQSAPTIESELEWLGALRRDTALAVPRPLPGRDGRLLQNLRPVGEPERFAVLFACEPGSEPQPTDDLAAVFETLGGLAATAHDHAMRFTPSGKFIRQVWTAEAVLDADGLWGDWRQAPHVEGRVAATLAELDRCLRLDLAAYGRGPDRFGLIHADMRLANLLVDGDRVTLIDFDDCGFCWFLYDFAAAISFFEDSPQVPVLRQRWLRGYTAVRPLAPADLDMLDAMVLLRRMALLAWIVSHRETALAQAHAADFARVTAELAAPYLAARSARPAP